MPNWGVGGWKFSCTALVSLLCGLISALPSTTLLLVTAWQHIKLQRRQKKNTFCPTNTQQITVSVCLQLLSHTGASAAAELCPSEGRANKGLHLAPGAPGGFAAGSDLRPKYFISLTQNGSSGFVHGPGAPPAREELNHRQ